MVFNFALMQWTSGLDLAIDVFSLCVIILIAISAIKFYKINNQQKKYRYLIASFILLAISFIFKIFTHFTIYYTATQTRYFGNIAFVYQSLKSSYFLVFWGLLGYRVLSLLAFYFLYLTYVNEKTDSKMSIILIAYLIFIASYFSQSAYYIYYISSFFILYMIVDKIYTIYQNTKYKKTKLLVISFSILMLSQAVSILININEIFYLIAELIQLTGFIILLYTFLKVLKDVKTQQDRYNT